MELLLPVSPPTRIDVAHRIVRRGDEVRTLTETEVALVAALAEANGQVVEREILHERCFGEGVPLRAVDFAIRRLRAKIEADPRAPRSLVTVHGEGYRLIQARPAPAQPSPASAARVPPLVLGERAIELDSGAVSGGGALTSMERAVLAVLVEHEGRVVSREQLLRRIWRGRSGRQSRRPDAVIRSLRAKLEPDPARPHFIRSVISGGWKLERACGRTNLAPELSPLVGRAHELDELLALLGRHRWVEITGPAGVGKSRLARAALQANLERWSGGAWWAEGPGSLWERLARALGAADAQQGAVVAVLACRSPLLVGLDDLPPEEGPLVGELLVRLPGLRVLSTAQTRSSGQRGSVAHSLRLDPLRPEEAQALFCARAERVRHDFRLDEGQQETLMALLARLDHLPLAIELAASRVDTIDLDWMVRHLDPLEPAPGTGLSLQAALQSSWERLPLALQQVLAAATLFQAPFDPAALAALPLQAGPLAADLLVRSCWLQPVETPVGRRLWWLQTTRAFVRERARPGQDCVLAYARWFASLARELLAGLRGPRSARTRLELTHALSDLREASLLGPLEVTLAVAELLDTPPAVPPSVLEPLAARWVALHEDSALLWVVRARDLAWRSQHAAAEQALARAVALGLPEDSWKIRSVRAFLADERDEADSAAPGPAPEEPVARMTWLFRASRSAPTMAEAEGLALELLELARRHQDRYAERLGLAMLAVLAWLDRQLEPALAWTEQQLALERQDGLLHLLPYTLHQLCLILLALGEVQSAETALLEAESLARPLGEDALTVRLLSARSSLLLEKGDLRGARRHGAAVVRQAEAISSRLDAWGGCMNQVMAALLGGDHAEALRLLQDARRFGVKPSHASLERAYAMFIRYLQTGERAELPPALGLAWHDQERAALAAAMHGEVLPDHQPGRRVARILACASAEGGGR